MGWFQTSQTTAAAMVTKLNNEGVPFHSAIIVHDGTNFVAFYYK